MIRPIVTRAQLDALLSPKRSKPAKRATVPNSFGDRTTAFDTFVLKGAPRTKKNSGRVLLKGYRKFHVSSVAHQAWNQYVQVQLADTIKKAPPGTFPIRELVNVRALFFRHANVGDAVGFYQALADALEEAGIVENDRQIVQWDGSRLAKDAADPRVIVSIEVLT